MLVQRLMERLAKLRSWLAARLGAMVAALRSAGRGAASGTAPREGRLSTQQSGSWLDDAHRLRPRRAALATADQMRGNQTASGEPRPGAPTRPIVPSTPPPETRLGRPWQFPAHPAPMPAPTPAPATPPPAAPAPDSREGNEVQARRRLMSLRYLVRIGLYNEGFAPSAVPEQYQRSLGTDDEPEDAQ